MCGAYILISAERRDDQQYGQDSFHYRYVKIYCEWLIATKFCIDYTPVANARLA